MNNKDFQKWLAQFPDDAIITVVEASKHSSSYSEHWNVYEQKLKLDTPEGKYSYPHDRQYELHSVRRRCDPIPDDLLGEVFEIVLGNISE